MSPAPPRPVLDSLLARQSNYTSFKEKSFGVTFEVWEGAPCAWSEALGATHTLYCGEGHGRGTRPARLLKTVCYVGLDEALAEDGEKYIIVWEKWDIKHR